MTDATVLFELSELASFVQSDLDEATATLARQLATGAVQDAIGQQVFRSETTDRLMRDPIDPRVLVLPQKPVDASQTITCVGIDDGITYAYLAADFELYGQRLVLECGAWQEQVDVTYTHGFSTIPATIKSVALACAARVVSNPAGVRSVSVGDVSVTNAGSDGDLTSGAYLTDHERRMIKHFGVTRQPMVRVL